MRSRPQEQLVCGVGGGIWRTLRGYIQVYILVTLRHFDNKLVGTVNYGPLIPCERRLSKTEIWEFQELTFEARFENRDYGRPFTHISVTLCRFD